MCSVCVCVRVRVRVRGSGEILCVAALVSWPSLAPLARPYFCLNPTTTANNNPTTQQPGSSLSLLIRLFVSSAPLPVTASDHTTGTTVRPHSMHRTNRSTGSPPCFTTAYLPYHYHSYKGTRAPPASSLPYYKAPLPARLTVRDPKAQAWSSRPHLLGVRISPWYAYSISPRMVIFRS